MGGTFNPPHNGHIHAARQAVAALRLERLLLIPDNIPPHKTMPRGSADSAQRLEMTRLMARGIPGAEVSDIELTRGGRSYTVDTVSELRTRIPDGEFYLIIGTDMLVTLHEWRRTADLCRMVTFAVVARGEDDRAAIREAAARLRAAYGARIEIVDCPALPVSSTDVRASRALCRRMVPPEIYHYIEQQGLYF